MTNEKDANEIHKLFLEFHYADDLGVIKSKLAEYVATVRKEEREAALKKAIKIAKAEAFERRMAYCVVDALEAVLTEK